MAIQIVNLAVPNGDTPRSANTKINANFTDQTHAASRLVGTESGNVMEVGAFGVGGIAQRFDAATLPDFVNKLGSHSSFCGSESVNGIGLPNYAAAVHVRANDSHIYFTASPFTDEVIVMTWVHTQSPKVTAMWTDRNATRDSNGFLKAASPIAELYSDKIGLNDDAIAQGNITFEKLGIGDYLIKGSLGFAQEGWYIETPKDANGNVLVAVVYEQLENNDLSIKTYAKKFDDETGDIVANLAKPRDIPIGRFISLRLHELPKEPPVMPTEV